MLTKEQIQEYRKKYQLDTLPRHNVSSFSSGASAEDKIKMLREGTFGNSNINTGIQQTQQDTGLSQNNETTQNNSILNKVGEFIKKGIKSFGDTAMRVAVKQYLPPGLSQVLPENVKLPVVGDTSLRYSNDFKTSTKQMAEDTSNAILGANATSAIGRIGLGTTFGSVSGLRQGLEQNKNILDTTKEVAKGAITGAAVGLFFEGLGSVLKSTVGKLGKNTYNKELQPDVKELTTSIKRNAETFGEQVRNAVDENGKPIYQGTYKTMMNQAQNQIETNGEKLSNALAIEDAVNPTEITRQQAAGDIVSSLQDQYGNLTKNQLKTIQEFVKKMPATMDRTGALESKRLFDGLLSKTDWSKIAQGTDAQASFAAQVKYLLRTNLKNLIENSTDNVAVKELNQSMSLAMDVRDLTAKQIAMRAKDKLQGSIISRAIGKIWDDYIFNPAFTTRGSQFAKNLGTNVGQTPLRQATRNIITNKIIK